MYIEIVTCTKYLMHLNKVIVSGVDSLLWCCVFTIIQSCRNNNNACRTTVWCLYNQWLCCIELVRLYKHLLSNYNLFHVLDIGTIVLLLKMHLIALS